MRLQRNLLLLPIVASFNTAYAATISHRQIPPPKLGRDDRAPLFPLVSWIRDAAIEFVFGRPATREHDSYQSNPSRWLNQYADNVVIRFKISTAEEAHSFSEISARLLLDTWATTDEYVDIRMRKNDIAPFLRSFSVPPQYSTLIPDVASLVYNSYPSTIAKSIGGFESTRFSTISPALQGDHFFFSDYQPLPVRNGLN
jgi:extracellular matrix protein 14